MAINLERIIHFKIVSSNVDSNVFIEFIDELIIKLTNDEIRNSLLILDNAKVHKTKEAIKKYKDNNLKILTNIPYKSQFNGIEYIFGHFKNMYYKFVLSNKKEQITKIREILASAELEKNLISSYVQAYQNYINFIENESKKLKIENLYKKVINKEEDNKSEITD